MKKIIGLIIASVALAPLLMMRVSAQSGTSTPSTAQDTKTCVAIAVERRETAVSAAVDQFAAGFKSALAQRKNALIAALDVKNKKDRKTKIKNAMRSFREEKKAARKTFDDARKKAWEAFRADLKTCNVPHEDFGGVGEDNL